jgi:phage FluMu protein Com
MSLKVLVAGCAKDEREQAEAQVRQALGTRAEGSSWTVSLVRIAGQWSVTLDAPSAGVRSRNFMAGEGRLREAIMQALSAPAPRPGMAPATAPERSLQRQGEPCRCAKCGKAYVVVYEAAPDEPEESVAVACPHCWTVNHVLVAESAAESRDYRAEKA